jgi:hypothetical protein
MPHPSTSTRHWLEGVRTAKCIFTGGSLPNCVPFDVVLSAEDGYFPVCGQVAGAKYLTLKEQSDVDAVLEPECIFLEIDETKVAGMIKSDIRRHLIECSKDGEIDVKFIKPSKLQTLFILTLFTCVSYFTSCLQLMQCLRDSYEFIALNKHSDIPLTPFAHIDRPVTKTSYISATTPVKYFHANESDDFFFFCCDILLSCTRQIA